MRNRTIYATQGGGMAEIIGRHAYFTEELNVPGAYRYNAGDKVPDEWDLIPITQMNDSKTFEQTVADQKALEESFRKDWDANYRREFFGDPLAFEDDMPYSPFDDSYPYHESFV
jgi:hypothetical protein